MLKRPLSLLVACLLISPACAEEKNFAQEPEKLQVTEKKKEETNEERAARALRLFRMGKVNFQPDTAIHKQNLDKAFDYFTAAGIAGNIDAIYYLAMMYEEGKGVEKDKEKAKFYFESAAKLGQPDALVFIGTEHVARGINLKQDSLFQKREYAQAVQNFQQAAKLGNLEAMFWYGDMLVKGLGIEKNEEKGNEILHEAADAGNNSAITMLGVNYWQGNGIKKNISQAYKWMLISKKQQNETAITILDEMGKEITASQKKQAEKLADEFKPKPLVNGKPKSL